MKLEFEYVHRGWVKALAATHYTVDALVKQNGVIYDAKTQNLKLIFPNVDVALNCVSENRDFEILRNQKQYTFVEFTAGAGEVRPKDMWGLQDYVIPAYESGEAIAYIPQQGDAITPLQIVKPEQISGNNQIAIAEGGLISSSKNIYNKHVIIRNLPIMFPEVIRELQKPLPGAIFYLIVTDDDGLFKLFIINEPEIIPCTETTNAEKIIMSKIDPEKIECRAFS